jgi:hypothetical protein
VETREDGVAGPGLALFEDLPVLQVSGVPEGGAAAQVEDPGPVDEEGPVQLELPLREPALEREVEARHELEPLPRVHRDAQVTAQDQDVVGDVHADPGADLQDPAFPAHGGRASALGGDVVGRAGDKGQGEQSPDHGPRRCHDGGLHGESIAPAGGWPPVPAPVRIETHPTLGP